MQVKIQFPDQEITKEYEQSLTLEEILSSCTPTHQIFAVKVNGIYESMHTKITTDCTVSFYDIRDNYANMVMQGSLILLYLKAIHQVVNERVKVSIANSLSKGLFTIIHTGNINAEVVANIEACMKELVAQKLVITETEMNRKDLMHWLKEKGNTEELSLYESAPDLQHGYVSRLEGEEDVMYYHLVPNTSFLSLFELRRYRNGVLLRFPQPYDMDHVLPYQEQPLLYEAFSEETSWESLLNVNYVADLNRCIQRGEAKHLIQLSEALHEKKISEIAQLIHNEGKRLILIAGPSSSGKTSFAKRLCIQLEVAGSKPIYLGTDDYFLNREELVVDENGKTDFEGLGAVDVELFKSQMNDLLAGKQVDLPTFNFITGKKEYGSRITSIQPNQSIVIEGIHGLNPALTVGIPDEEKVKIYISPLTQLDLDRIHRVPTTDARMLRRLVRDYRTRGKSAIGTIEDWKNVRAGEEKNIFPYSNEADLFFNSQCIYELAVLKKYAEPLLKQIPQEESVYAEAQRMLQFLRFFVSIEEDGDINNSSLIREFIGGSILVG